jgi:hypothetical protein
MAMKNKKRNKLIFKEFKNISVICIMVSFSLLLVAYLSGCAILGVEDDPGSEENSTLEIPDVRIDEREIEEIGRGDENMKKSYEAETDIYIIDESARDPFKPFYASGGDEGDEKNIIKLENIYSKDKVYYADINVNEYTYVLEVADTLGDVYVVMAINDDSVVLQKGDELLTLFMGVPLYD